MHVTTKAQITIKALTENDEVVTYSTDDHSTCLKMRTIGGKRTFIKDVWNMGAYRSETFKTLTAAKRGLTINHF